MSNINKELTVFPNPSFDRINFEFKSKSNQEFIVQIVNLKGQLIFTKKQRDNFVDVSNLPKGSYILTIQTSSEFYSSQFFKK